MNKKERLIIPLVIPLALPMGFLLIAAVYAFFLRGLSPDDSLYPKFVLYVLIFLDVIFILQVLFKKNKEVQGKLFKDFKAKQIFSVFVIGLIYLILISILGYFTSTFIFMFSLLVVLKSSVKTSLIITLGFCIFIYLVFKMFLGVPVPTGIMF